jgi:hypothetical protein
MSMLSLLLFRFVVAQVELEPPPETALAASASKTCAHRTLVLSRSITGAFSCLDSTAFFRTRH